jgi:hypothetical protein
VELRAVSQASVAQPSVEQLSGLVYELLDAHADTIGLAQDSTDELTWAAHLDYLRDLQRVGREVLARTASCPG